MYTYTQGGVYTVTQWVTDTATGEAAGVTRTHYITVYTPVEAGFTAVPTSGVAPLTVVFTNTTTGDYTASLWQFGDGVTSTLRSPSHIYGAGVYTVSLTAGGPGGSDTVTRSHYITVSRLATTTIVYGYDGLYRLTSATYSTGQVYTYTYDQVGNRLAMGVDGQVTSYEYDEANRLTQVGNVEYTWDDNGNLLADGVRSYEYDDANRLTAVVSGTVAMAFAYNGDGHRMSETINGVTTTYVVAVLGLSQVLVETTGGETTCYVFGHDLLAEHDGVAWAYHLDDGLGSVRQLADEDGQVTLAQSYAPFGEPLWSEGSGTTGFGFTGERWEAYTGLLFLRARYYEPAIGRFTSKDLWSGSMHSPATLNPFVYVENQVIGRVDPSGLRSIPKYSSAGGTGFRQPECGPGCWFLVSAHKFKTTLYYTPNEWDFPPPTDQVYEDVYPDDPNDLVLPGTGEKLKKLRLHPEFWKEVRNQGSGALDERNEPGEPHVPKGVVLRFFKELQNGLPRRPLWSVAYDDDLGTQPGTLKKGDRICILEFASLTRYHGNFGVVDTGDGGNYWLDIYVGQGKESITTNAGLSTHGEFTATVLRPGRPGETCPCTPQPY